MKPEQLYRSRMRLCYSSRDGVVTISHAALSEMQRRMSMTKDECAVEDEVVNTWLRAQR